ncbi:hypothetical protein I2F27_06505 [Acinetobacter sp. B5B]|uniref:hypothetical protein n=1 Tax=Acinetobacter baretiae TaxID=2605383 RepID=UPI0018C1E3F7|nr:hypothetical protein [Acinetobacter baretiae]MBF7682976.1 hypothetical protein [Acinetobacter baretiae]
MTALVVSVSNSGVVSPSSDSSAALQINYDLHSYLGSDVNLEVKFLAKVTSPTQGSHIVCQLRWVDTATDTLIYQVQGTLNDDEDDYASLWSIAGATEYFKSFDITYNNTNLITAIKSSSAYNSLNSLSKNVATFTLVDDEPSAFDADQGFNLLSTLRHRPSDIAMIGLKNLSVYNAILRALEQMNVPFTIELDPTLTIDQAVAMVDAVDANDHRVQFIWSPNLCRPRDAISLRGRKKPAYAMGVYLGYKALRNANVTAKGIPPIGTPIAGADYPFSLKAIEQRGDIVFGSQELEQLAVAKINVVRLENYDIGERFVLSDVLTQYQSKDSALRIVNAAEITCYTENKVIDILKRHMLKKTDSFLTDAGRDITHFLNNCVSANLLKSASDLGGQPYVFELKEDEQYPFERVRLYLARRVVGAVRSVVFDDVIVK